MNILILHRRPYYKVKYHLGIDHERHEVTYIGTVAQLADIPPTRRCRRVERLGRRALAEEVSDWLQSQTQAFDRVLALSEYDLLDAAHLRAWFGIPGPLPGQIEKVRNKVVMKRLVAEIGLRTPRFLPLAALLDAADAAPWSGRTVLKPVDGASSEDVTIFESPRHARAAVTTRQSGVERLDHGAAQQHRYEVEEFVEGPILHFDGLVMAGRLRVVTASRYIGTCLDYAQGHPLGSVQIPLTEQAREWVITVLRAVGIEHGSFHLEAIQNAQNLVFLEVAGRVGGADVVDTFELATGIHLPSEELKLLLDGERASLSAPVTSNHWFGWFVFPGHHLGATHCRLQNYETFAQSPLMLRWHRLSEDQPLPRHITYQALEAPAAGLVRASSSDEAEMFMQTLFRAIRIVPAPAPEAALS